MGFLWVLWQATKVCVFVFVGIPLSIALVAGMILIPMVAIVVSPWYLALFLLYPFAGVLLYWIIEVLLDTVGIYW